MVWVSLPLLGGPNSLYFDSTNVTDFLEWMDLIFDKVGVTEDKWLGYAIRYYKRAIAEYVKVDATYLVKDWEGLKAFL